MTDGPRIVVAMLKGNGIGLKIVMLKAFHVEELSGNSNRLVATDCSAFVAVKVVGKRIRSPTVVVMVVMSSEEYVIEIGKLGWLNIRNCRAFIDVVSVIGRMVWVWVVCKLLSEDIELKPLTSAVMADVKATVYVDVAGKAG